MKNNINKINKLFISVIFSLFLVYEVDALKAGDIIKIEKDSNSNWKVVKVNEVNGSKIAQCDIKKPENPKELHIVAKEFPMIGYTYENVCKKISTVSHLTYTLPTRYKDLFGVAYNPQHPAKWGDSRNFGDTTRNPPPQPYNTQTCGKNTPYTQFCPVGNYGTGSTFRYKDNNGIRLLNSISKVYEDDKNNRNLFDNKLKLFSPSNNQAIANAFQMTVSGYNASEAAEMAKGNYFVAHWTKCSGWKRRGCMCQHCDGEGSNQKCTWHRCDQNGENVTKNYWPSPTNTDASKAQVSVFLDSLPDPPECEYDLGITKHGNCEEPWYRAPIKTEKTFCSDIGPAQVEVYGYDLKINNKDAFCVTPSAGYNKAYFWDNRFDASKCKNSLQMYKSKVDSTGKTILTEEYDIDCGYAYIMAEAKRLNESIKEQTGQKDYFSYGAITTAMKMFGTGIVGNKDENGKLLYYSDLLNSAINNKQFLESAGYYTTYYGWGYGEYVGIPWVRDVWGTNRSSWPGIYQHFLPEFYSIFIHTAKVASSYLINDDTKKIRFADVGNVKDSNGDYITDPFYYLKPRKCELYQKNCRTQNIAVQYNDNLSIAMVDSNMPMDGSLLAWLQSSDSQHGGKKYVCEDESGYGVLCGLRNEKGNAEYIKSIYLYIRALQGNELIFEKKVAQSIDQYKPVEGLTKYIYEINGESVLRFAIDTKISAESVNQEVEVSCNTDPNNKQNPEQCNSRIFIFDSAGNQLLFQDHYDYCKKNYCYVKIDSSKICDSTGNTKTLTAIVVTDPGLKSTTIKKLVGGKGDQQTIFVYDDDGVVTGGFCQEIAAVQENISVKCPCNPKENANLVESNGNINKDNVCSNNYNTFDELYYGDPSMSTILNACYEEDKLKYDFTKDLNINGNNIVYDAELQSKYSFQVKSDDFNVCKLYCRDESRFYIANKVSVKAGQHLRYDIGQTLIDKKIINETAKDKGIKDTNNPRNQLHNYMPSVVLQFRECTTEIDYNKWKDLYTKASNERLKTQLLYSIYNCNLYTTDEINEAIGKTIATNSVTNYNELQKYAEPAMIEYKYHTETGNISVEKIYGTTKEYLLSQEGCTSLGLDQTDCATYLFGGYKEYTKISENTENPKEENSYYNTLGVSFDFEHGLVDSNLNDTIYCSGNSCYKLKDNLGNYYYNPYALNKNDYTTVDNIYNNGEIKKHESGKILSYQDWGLKHEQYNKNSDNYVSTVVGGYKVPTNQYASFIVVTETGFYNNKDYYVDSYSGLISTEKRKETDPIRNEKLERNIFPLHLDIETGSYEVKHRINNTKTAYKRSSYYEEKNYALFDKINGKPGEFNYICSYDIYNTTTKYEKSLGFLYRMVNLNDVFASVTNETRRLPENWATNIGKKSLEQIQASSSNILEHDGDNDEISSYLEYSYTLTPEGIKRIRQWNSLNEKFQGYLDNTTFGCEYDEEEKIFYNCKSAFLVGLDALNGSFSGIITVNKGDGVSEFCTDKHNEKEIYCKYQHKTAGGGLSEFLEEIIDSDKIEIITGGND